MTTLGFIGGTGDLGKALAIHLASGYEKTLIGSREKPKAEKICVELVSKLAEREYLKDKLVPAENKQVAGSCDIIIVTLPAKYAVDGVKELAGHFRGNQLLISTVAPTPKMGDQYLPSLGGNGKPQKSSSITKQLKEATALDSIRVATAFQTVPAKALLKEKRIEADVPITSDDKKVYEETAEVVRKIEGLRPLYMGTLEVSGVAEGMTSILLNVGTHNNLKDPILKFMAAEGGKKS